MAESTPNDASRVRMNRSSKNPESDVEQLFSWGMERLNHDRPSPDRSSCVHASKRQVALRRGYDRSRTPHSTAQWRIEWRRDPSHGAAAYLNPLRAGCHRSTLMRNSLSETTHLVSRKCGRRMRGTMPSHRSADALTGSRRFDAIVLSI